MNWKRVVCVPSYYAAALLLSALAGRLDLSWDWLRVWQHGVFAALSTAPVPGSGIPALVGGLVVFFGLTVASIVRPSLLWALVLTPTYALWLVYGKGLVTGNFH